MAIKKKPKCLIVDADSDFLAEARKALYDVGLQYVEILNKGDQVLVHMEQAELSGEMFDLIIINTELDDISGFEVIKRIKENYNYKNIPILMMTDDHDKFPLKDCFLAGANDYVAKPFESSVFSLKVEALYKIYKDGKANFCPIRCSTFMIGSPVLFDAYITQYGQYRIVLKHKDIVTESHVKRLKDYAIKRLYITSESEPLYQKYLEKNIKVLMDTREIDTEDKAEFLSDYGAHVLADVCQNINDKNIQQIDKISSVISGFVDNEGSEAILALTSVERETDIFRHCLNVASICMLITNKITELKQSKKKREKYADILRPFEGIFESKGENHAIMMDAALLHDIGKTHKDYVLENDLNGEHAELGEEILDNIRGVEPKVKEIVAQHEEFCDGTGGPNKLTKNKTSLYAQILSLANSAEIQMSAEGTDLEDLDYFLTEYKEKFHPQLISILKMVMK